MSVVAVSLKDVRFYMRNVRTRMPFKYGVAVLTSVPILHVVVRCELINGTVVEGVAADILPPKWFDKDPVKDYVDNVDDLLFAARAAADAYLQAAQNPRSFFSIWQDGYAHTLEAGDGRGLNHLAAAHGSTLMERALIDAVGCGVGASYFQSLKDNILGLDLAVLHPELAGVTPSDVLGAAPLTRLYVRHTVGLVDPITAADVPDDEWLDDGLPQTLEEYARQGIVYYKVKVNGDLEADLARLQAIAALLDGVETDYRITLDGNEQYGDMETFIEFLVRVEDELPQIYNSVLYIEQPLERSVALDPAQEAGIRAAASWRPMLIDESDEELDTYRRALDLGYQGVSSKACKGLVKALANLALARQGEGRFLSGEDLMNLPVVPLHQDLAHVAALGIGQVERNGHHYVRGLAHLANNEREGCLATHGDMYARRYGLVALDVRDGAIEVESLQIPGLGVGVGVEVEEMVALEDGDFASLA